MKQPKVRVTVETRHPVGEPRESWVYVDDEPGLTWICVAVHPTRALALALAHARRIREAIRAVKGTT